MCVVWPQGVAGREVTLAPPRVSLCVSLRHETQRKRSSSLEDGRVLIAWHTRAGDAQHDRVERLGRVEAREHACPRRACPLALVLPRGVRPAAQRTVTHRPADLVEDAVLVVEGDGVVQRVTQAPRLVLVVEYAGCSCSSAAAARHQAHGGVLLGVRFRRHDAVPVAKVVALTAPLDHATLRPRRPARVVLPGAGPLGANDQRTPSRLPRDDGLVALDREGRVEL